MAKVITTIVADDGMDFDYIMSFKTENYIGIWDNVGGRFVLLDNSGSYFKLRTLKNCENLKELDDAVYAKIEEHILEVFDHSNYTIELG